jgi:AsmA protein
LRRAVKWALISVASLIAVSALAVAYLAATFDPNDYKSDVIRLVKEKTGRTLQLEGAIGLTFYPTLGIKVGAATLSERHSEREFASVAEALVAVKLMPLLSKQVLVDAIEVKGLRATITRDKSGRYNVDDLTKADEKKHEDKPADALKIDIDHITISDGDVTYVDRAASAHYRLSKFNLKTGRVVTGIATPLELSALIASNKHHAQLDTKMKGKLSFDLDRQVYKLEDADFSSKGSVSGFSGMHVAAKGSVEADVGTGEFSAKTRAATISGRTDANLDLKVEAPVLTVTKDKISGEKVAIVAGLNDTKSKLLAKVSLAGVQATMKSVKASALDAHVETQENGRITKAHLTGALTGNPEAKRIELPNFAANIETQKEGRTVRARLSGPLTGNLETRRFELPGLALSATVSDPKLPRGGFDTTINGAARADLARETGTLDFTGKLDQSNVNGKAAITKWSPLAVTFDVSADQLDIDRLLTKTPVAKAAPVRQTKGPTTPNPAQGDKIDFSALKGFSAAGTVKIGKLTALKLKTSQVRADVKVANGHLELAPISAQLYQGTLKGSFTAQAASTAFTVKQTLSGVAIGPLLRDAANIDKLEAKGTVDFALATQGTTVDALKKALNGTTAVNLADGSLRGIDIAGTIRSARNRLRELRGQQVQEANTALKTDFTELKATFSMKNGVAHNTDLVMKSPLLRVGGAGDFDIGHDRTSYLLRATVVATTKGQGGKDLAELNGLTVPVKLTGALGAPQYSIDFTGMAIDLAKREAERELLRRATGQTSGLGSVRERVKEILGH